MSRSKRIKIQSLCNPFKFTPKTPRVLPVIALQLVGIDGILLTQLL
jgi:hypothetical protein